MITIFFFEFTMIFFIKLKSDIKNSDTRPESSCVQMGREFFVLGFMSLFGIFVQFQNLRKGPHPQPVHIHANQY